MGHKIQRQEILDIKEYNQKRDSIRENIFKIKQTRRFHLGDFFTFLFENKDTVWYQIQEMLRVENISDEDAIIHEINTYNEIAPDRGEIKSTLLIEIDDEVYRKYKLKELLGLEDHIFLFYENLQNEIVEIRADFDNRQYNRERISSVQYLTFRLNENQQKEFLDTKKAGIKVTHPAYYLSGYFKPDILQSIKEDLKKTLE